MNYSLDAGREKKQSMMPNMVDFETVSQEELG